LQKVRVLVVDDHSVVRAGVRMLVDAQPDMEVVGEAAEGEEAVAKVGELMPDVVLMDIHMPGVNGLQATRQIKKRFPQVCVLALTMYDNEEYFFEMLSAGGSGYVLKNAAPSELVSAIRAVHKGGSYLYPTVARALVDDYLGRVAAGGERTTYNVLTKEYKVASLKGEQREPMLTKDLREAQRVISELRVGQLAPVAALDKRELYYVRVRSDVSLGGVNSWFARMTGEAEETPWVQSSLLTPVRGQ